MLIVSTWLHGFGHIDRAHLPKTVEELTRLTLELGLMAAALVRGWSEDIGITPEEFLQDLALTQARGELDLTQD